ncbi:uncharacterized protein [Periplaneta americana]|uniref:uncharacterized protein n=1 Tax=Periplaneta americana TaxID=6978 RepID=UPI0037E90589
MFLINTIVLLFLSCVVVCDTETQESQNPKYEDFKHTVSRTEPRAKEEQDFIALPQNEDEGVSTYVFPKKDSRTGGRRGKQVAKDEICCGNTPKLWKRSDDVFKKCLSEIKTGYDERATRNKVCIAQCIGEKKFLVNNQGYVKQDAFLNAVSYTYIKPGFKTLIEKIVATCVAESNQNAENSMSKNLDGDNCNPASLMTKNCFERELVLNCPADQVVEGEECDQVRQRMKESKDKKDQRY